MKHSFKNSGNIFFLLFAAVGMAGVVGLSVQNYVMSPMKSASGVNRKNSAETQMQLGIRVAATNAVTQQASSGDCDGDGMVEPLPYVDPGANPAPVGGGLLPSNIGSVRMDPWNTQYGYCVWDHGSAIDDAGCGGAPQLRLPGTNAAEWETMAVISAGPDKVFQTTCNAWADVDVNNQPDTPLVNKPATSDDVYYAWTYQEASSGSGGLWTLETADPNTAEINKNISVKDGSNVEQLAFDAATKALTIGTGGSGEIPTVKTDFFQALSNPAIQVLDGISLLPEDGSGANYIMRNLTGDTFEMFFDGTKSAFYVNSAVSPPRVEFYRGSSLTVPTHRFTNDALSVFTMFSRTSDNENNLIEFYTVGNDTAYDVGMENFIRSRHNTTSGVINDTAQIRFGIQTKGPALTDKSGYLSFHTRPTGTAANANVPERMRISNSGNVGIGTSSPSAPLHVAGGNTVLADGGAFRVGVGTTSPQVALDVAGTARVGTTASACTPTNNGAIRYSSGSSCIELCDGSNWSCTQSTACGTPLPTAFNFTDATNAALSTSIESNIVQITGISTCILNVSVSGASGSPQYRICTNGTSDSTCDSSVVQDWTSARSTISNNQYVQMRMTSSSINSTYNLANLVVGNRAVGWGITTTAGASCSDQSPPIGMICSDGTRYVGRSLQTGNKMFTTICPSGKYWDGFTCKGADTRYRFSNNNTILTGATSATNGQSNTTTLAGLSNADAPYIAAGYCSSLVHGGSSQWYLPAWQEASNMIRPNCTAYNPIYSDCNGDYTSIWSSTDISTTNAAIWAWPVYYDTQSKSNYFPIYCMREDGVCDADIWTLRNAAEANPWRAVTYANGLFVAVSATGTNRVMTSPDGINWTPRSVPASNHLVSITYGNGLFVAVAFGGATRVMTSPDGINWTGRAALAGNWHSVTYGNGLFVAVAFTGGANQVMTSPDGINWTARTAAQANDWHTVIYGGGQFVAVSTNGTNRVMTSPDGITWTARTAAAANSWTSVAYGNGLYVATATDGTNRVMTSPNGITWTSRSAPEANQWRFVTYGNGQFVSLAQDGTNRVMTSRDGITWTVYPAAQANEWESAVFANGLFVAVSETGTNRVMTAGCGASVCTAETWTARTAAEANDWRSVTYGNGLFVAVSEIGTTRVMTSPDGITWTGRTAAQANEWTSVTYGNGLFVAVAETGTNRVMTSPDGITWTARTAAEANQWVAVTYGNGLFVAIARSGTNRVMTSPDGITWTARAAAQANNWSSITYGNGLFVAVSWDGTNRVMTSPDGITWTGRTAAEANEWSSVTFGNDIFVAVTWIGTNRVMTSHDGITWTARTAAANNGWSSVTFGNGIFVAVSDSGANRVMTSPNGINWTSRTASEANTWTSVTFGNSLFVAVSLNGTNRVMTAGCN